MTRVSDPSLLRITETAAGLVEGASGSAVAEDGTVTIHMIRPCLGKGKGRHVYEAAMLKQHAESGHFNDWSMYLNHESAAARRAAGGLPRKIQDLGGRIVETWWDESVPAEDRFGQGAVCAKVLPVPYVQDLIRHDPKLIEASINTHATGVKPTTRGGRPAYVVEGFESDGTVDWVTRAGAGGKVVSLMEAYIAEHEHDDDAATINQLLEGFGDDKIAAYLRDERPHLAETLNDAPTGEEDDVKPEELEEAITTHLGSEAGKAQLTELFGEVAQTAVSEALTNVLPGAIGAATSVIEAQATAAATKAVRMGALRAKAETAVSEAKLSDESELPEKFRQHVLEAIGMPDVDDTIEGEGDEAKVTETAETKFAAILEAELKKAAELVEAARPEGIKPPKRRRRTAVTGNGSGADPKDGEHVLEADDEEGEVDTAPYRESLQEAGVDWRAAWGVPEKDPKKKTEPEAAAATA